MGGEYIQHWPSPTKPSTKEAPVCEVEAPAHSTASTETPRSPEEEARDILATAAKNQTEDGPSTRRACECFTDHTLAHPLNCRGGVVA